MSDVFELEKAPEYKPIELLEEDSEHNAKVIKAELKEMPFKNDDGSAVHKVNFVFELVGEGSEYEYTDKEGNIRQKRVYGDVYATFNDSPLCKLRAWVTEIFGADELPEGFRFSLEDLADKECRVIMEINEYPDKRAPRSTWVEDINTGDLTPPKKRNNRVKDVLRANVGALTGRGQSEAFTLDTQADDTMEDEPF